MAVHDIRSDLQHSVGDIAIISTNTTTNGAIIDTADFENGLMFAVLISLFTDGVYDFTIEEGDDSGLSDAAAVSIDKLIGTLAALQLTAANVEGDVLKTIGLFSNKRFVRINTVSTGVTTGATIVTIVTERGEDMPVV